MPLPAIIGLSEGVSAVEQIGIENVERHERGLFELLKNELLHTLCVILSGEPPRFPSACHPERRKHHSAMFS